MSSEEKQRQFDHYKKLNETNGQFEVPSLESKFQSTFGVIFDRMTNGINSLLSLMAENDLKKRQRSSDLDDFQQFLRGK